jgi:dTDP-D-glucose 4,6-dehydratase
MYTRRKTEIKKILSISKKIQKAIERQQNARKYSVDKETFLKQIDWLLEQDLADTLRETLSGIKNWALETDDELTFKQLSVVKFSLADKLWEKKDEICKK